MQNFWDIIWIVIWSFVFIAYLMVFFRILTDLFSDRELGGWIKAVWVVALIFLPFLTALIYLVSRGRGMAERHLAAVRQAQGQTDAYIKQVAGAQSPAQNIADAKSLLDSGAITGREFDQLKAKALA